MKIRRIEVKNFRKLGHEVVEDLQDGLNVIVGDNEAGKSTLLVALRAALFERHRVTGATADEMQPFGDNVRPEVWLDFEINGQAWHLHKAFCQKPEATLRGPAGQITGDAVEERLAELLGFTPPGKGGSDPEKHHGTYSLLWVEQGLAHQSLRLGAGRESVASAIEGEVGEVLGGERGRALLVSAEQRRGVYWGKNNKPRGEWKQRQEAVVDLEGEIAELERELSTYESKVDELESKQAALTRYQVENRHEKAHKALERAIEAKAKADELATVAREVGTYRQLAESERDAASSRLEARQRLVQSVDMSRRALEAAVAEAEEAKGTLEVRRAASKRASESLARLRETQAAGAAHVSAVEAALSRQSAREELQRLTARETSCREAEEKRRGAMTAAGAITLTSEDIDALEELERKLGEAKAQLQAASVRIEFEPDGQRCVRLDDQEHDPGSPLLLAHDAQLELEGFGRFRIHPGGGVGVLAQRSQTAEQKLRDRLRDFGVATLSEARSELARKTKLVQEAEHQKGIAKAHAPEGLEALRQAINSRRTAAEVALPAGAEALGEVAELTLLEARQSRDAAGAARLTAEDAWNSAEASRLNAELAVATHVERISGKERDHAGYTEQLAQARAQATDAALSADLTLKDAVFAEQRKAEEKALADLDAADPEIIRLEWERARDAEDNIRREIDGLERAVSALRIELTALGRDGVGEELAELKGQLALKQKQLAVDEQEAAAARLLHDVLTQAQRESKERWLGPVRKRVEPYLRILHPDSDIVLHDDTLELDGFVRRGKKEPFKSLSMGAREQVAVITRLALADILRTTNQPSVVILDDALVNTDEARLQRMHLVLRKAAENLQVLVMTCRERDFHDIGGKTIRLQ